jgi:hypothetical protein
MIAPAAKALDAVVTFSTDPAADAGNAAPILAALLIGIDRRRREQRAAEQGNQAEQERAGQ